MVEIDLKPFKPGLKALLLFAGLSLLGCSDRPRSNPLDPRNPDQDQANVGFNALAGNRQVLLEWNQLNFIDLAGIRVQRVEAGTADTITLTDSLMLPVRSTSYLDQTPANGTTYLYNLQFELTSGSEKPKTMPDTVQPGSVFAWLELVDYGQLVLMTPDFRDELQTLEASFFNIQDVQVGRSIWVLNGSPGGYGVLSLFSFSGQLEEENLVGLNSVVAFQLNRRDNSVWIAIAGSSGFVYHFSSGGNLQGSRTTGIRVTSLALDQFANDLWVGSSEPSIARINLLGESVMKISHSSFVTPEKVVTTRGLPGVWVLDTGSRKAFRFTETDFEWEFGGFKDPRDIAVNIDGDLCWVADYGADAVVILDRQGRETGMITGLGMPYRLAFNVVDSTLYVSGLERKATKISQDGQILWQRSLPDRPGLIELAY